MKSRLGSANNDSQTRLKATRRRTKSSLRSTSKQSRGVAKATSKSTSELQNSKLLVLQRKKKRYKAKLVAMRDRALMQD